MEVPWSGEGVRQHAPSWRMPWAVSGQTSPAGLRTHTGRRRTARYAVGAAARLGARLRGAGGSVHACRGAGMVGQHRCGRTGCESRSAPARVPARPVRSCSCGLYSGTARGRTGPPVACSGRRQSTSRTSWDAWWGGVRRDRRRLSSRCEPIELCAIERLRKPCPVRDSMSPNFCTPL